jgi:hypothetical protein
MPAAVVLLLLPLLRVMLLPMRLQYTHEPAHLKLITRSTSFEMAAAVVLSCCSTFTATVMSRHTPRYTRPKLPAPEAETAIRQHRSTQPQALSTTATCRVPKAASTCSRNNETEQKFKRLTLDKPFATAVLTANLFSTHHQQTSCCRPLKRSSLHNSAALTQLTQQHSRLSFGVARTTRKPAATSTDSMLSTCTQCTALPQHCTQLALVIECGTHHQQTRCQLELANKEY